MIKWTYEACYEEAKKYKSRDEFYKNASGAYSSARIHKWLDDYTWFKPYKRWTYDEIKQEALKYKSKKEFRESNYNAYNTAKDNKWLKDFDWLIDERLDLYTDKIDSVYSYEFIEQHAVYIGRTLMRNQTKRDRDHIFSNDSVSSFAKSNNIPVPSMKILEDNLTLKEGVDKEGYWVEKYKLDGWIILNRTKTGSIGGLGKGKWNYSSCYEEAKRAEYRVLYEVVKYENTTDYLKFVLSEFSKIIDKFSGLSDYISIEEVDCSRSGYYYILVFMLRNVGEEKEESEITKLFKDNIYD